MIAQRYHWTSNSKVGGSNPSGRTIFIGSLILDNSRVTSERPYQEASFRLARHPLGAELSYIPRTPFAGREGKHWANYQDLWSRAPSQRDLLPIICSALSLIRT